MSRAIFPDTWTETDARRYVKGQMDAYNDIVSMLIALGNECCGGSGDQTNPQTGKPYGAPYYEMAEKIRERAPKGTVSKRFGFS